MNYCSDGHIKAYFVTVFHEFLFSNRHISKIILYDNLEVTKGIGEKRPSYVCHSILQLQCKGVIMSTKILFYSAVIKLAGAYSSVPSTSSPLNTFSICSITISDIPIKFCSTVALIGEPS